jgi:adenylosuccinate synthase
MLPDTIAYAPSPNAGHTLTWDGATFIHKMLPTGFTSPKLRSIILGPGSLLDLDLLQKELRSLRDRVYRINHAKVYIHANAAVVLPRHRTAESNGGTAPGSTRQGVGAAQIERIQRGIASTNLVHLNLSHPVFREPGVQVVNTAEMQREYWDSSRLQIESCQGYGLSIYHGQYPHTTSRDITVASILADVGAPWGINPDVYGSFRTYPIRVANRPEDGEYSGPSYPDSVEITFGTIGQQQELTTVTKLPRRIFTWSQLQATEACAQNRVKFGFLNFAQYPCEYKHLHDIWERLSELTMVRYLGFGPTINDIYKVSTPAISRTHIEKVYEQYR